MDLKLPPLGEGVDSGTVVGILVKEGDTIHVSGGHDGLVINGELAQAA